MTLGLSNHLCMFPYNVLIVALGNGLIPSGFLGGSMLVIDMEVLCLSGKSFFQAIITNLP